ncbi:hypothetical protein RFI_10094 [Reticulomyxa filosa]|uniref:Uncharacterized protein n=1 Tax=Reticulomyxa filosa TaxID=46433 RepID=X6NM87_RETFI|nr:hypothetical protein RFI_10094 [Reticulomyxa filosa]|eukprot:ETO27038.1 hypothetical protein RFI_10094 [Reticulomyxa filosa]
MQDIFSPRTKSLSISSWINFVPVSEKVTKLIDTLTKSNIVTNSITHLLRELKENNDSKEFQKPRPNVKDTLKLKFNYHEFTVLNYTTKENAHNKKGSFNYGFYFYEQNKKTKRSRQWLTKNKIDTQGGNYITDNNEGTSQWTFRDSRVFKCFVKWIEKNKNIQLSLFENNGMVKHFLLFCVFLYGVIVCSSYELSFYLYHFFCFSFKLLQTALSSTYRAETRVKFVGSCSCIKEKFNAPSH